MALKSSMEPSDILKSDKSDLKRTVDDENGENNEESSDSEAEIEVVHSSVYFSCQKYIKFSISFPAVPTIEGEEAQNW